MGNEQQEDLDFSNPMLTVMSTESMNVKNTCCMLYVMFSFFYYVNPQKIVEYIGDTDHRPGEYRDKAKGIYISANVAISQK